MTKIHCLKTWPEYYAAVVAGEKTFEIRKNDRDFRVGDVLILQEFNPDTQLPTQEMKAFAVTYITDFPVGLRDGYVVMGIKPYLDNV